MRFLEEALEEKEYVIACRRHIHENPELSDREDETVRFILEELKKNGISCEEVPGGGVMGYIDGAREGKSLILRANIDALPIQESPTNDRYPKSCVSRVDGVSHACGHDAHTAMLLASAKILNRHRQDFAGRILLYFERGEESGHGDQCMTAFIAERNIHADGAWGLHVAGLPSGVFGLHENGICAGGIGWRFAVERNEKALCSPIECVTMAIRRLQSLRMRGVSPFEEITLTPAKLIGDEDSCRIIGTCRILDRENVGIPLREKMYSVLSETAASCGYDNPVIVVGKPGYPVVNNPTCCKIAGKAIVDIFGAEKVVDINPTMGCESFNVLSSRYPSVFLRLGISDVEKGMTAPQHNPCFDICEDALPNGVAATVAYAFAFFAYDKKIPFQPLIRTRKGE